MNNKDYWFDFDALLIENSGILMSFSIFLKYLKVGDVKFDLLVKESGEYHCLITIQVHSDFTTEYSSVLGISEKAKNKEIDEAFRKEKENFKQKQEAYDFLKEKAMPEKTVSSEDEHSDEFTIIDEPDVSSDQEFSGDSWSSESSHVYLLERIENFTESEESDYECEAEIFDPCSILKWVVFFA